MRLSKRIAIRLAHLQGQKLVSNRLVMSETEYWEVVLTDHDRKMYHDLAKEAIRMTEEEGQS